MLTSIAMLYLYLLFAFTGLFLFIAAFVYRPKQKKAALPSTEKVRRILNEEVRFYQDLPADRKQEFQNRLMKFLSTVKITGVGTKAEELDLVLVAASAIIPIFGFPHWDYPKLKEVLLYPGAFDEQFRLEGNNRYTLGQVGTGPYRNVMILSKEALRGSFANKTGKSNVGIHEFAHLVDRMDGSQISILFLTSKPPLLTLAPYAISNRSPAIDRIEILFRCPCAERSATGFTGCIVQTKGL